LSRYICYLNEKNNEIIIYQTSDWLTKIDVTIENDTVWFTQNQMSKLFQTTRNNITMHIKNIFFEIKLEKDSVCKVFLLTAKYEKNYK
jgi:hypothetical protein